MNKNQFDNLNSEPKKWRSFLTSGAKSYEGCFTNPRKELVPNEVHTVDGSEIRQENQLRLVVYPIIYGVLYISGGAGYLPSTVWFMFHFWRS